MLTPSPLRNKLMGHFHPNALRSYRPSLFLPRRRQRVTMSITPLKVFWEGQYCTGWLFLLARKSYVLTSLSCTVPTGVVHHVPRSSIRMFFLILSRSCSLLFLSLCASESAVIMPPKPVPITATV